MQEIFDRSECALRLTYVKNNIFYILVNVIVGSCCLYRIPSFLLGNFLLQLILQLVNVCHLQNTPVPRFASFSDFRLLQLDCQNTQIQNLPLLLRHSLLQRNKPLSCLPPTVGIPLCFFLLLIAASFTGFFSDFIPFWKDAKLELVLLLV